MRKSWALAGAAVLVAAAATGGGVVVSRATRAAAAAQEPPANTAKVQRGNLSTIVSVDGTLTYQGRPDGSPYSVINQARGTYTTLPEGGDKISCGEVLYRVDEHPVLLLCGTVPAYRDLHTGDVGEDVRQLNQNLSKLGYAAAAGVDIDPDDSDFTWKTEKALRVMRRDKGFDVTGELDVAAGNSVSTVSATNSVAAPAQARLSFKSGGLLAQLLVNVGDQVAKGQPLAKLDDADLQVALTQARANYNSAVAKLELTKAGSRPEDIAAAQAQVDQAKAKVMQAQAVPQSPDVRAAQAQLDSAKSKLQQVLTGGSAGDVAAAQAQLDAANSKLQALTNPRPEDVKNVQAQLVSAQAKLQALTHPRPEDLAAAQSQVDQAKTKLAQLQDVPKTAIYQDVANAQLAVQSAQAALDKARAAATSVNLSRSASEADNQAAEATVRQAELAVVTAQNNLAKLQQQGPSEWDLRQAQLGLNSAQANLDKLTNPSPTDVQQAQAVVDQAQANLDKLKNPSPADVAAAQQAVAQAHATLDKLTTPSDYEVQQAQQAVNQAQATLDKLLSNNTYDLQNAQAALNQAQANLGKVQNNPTPQDLTVAQAAVDQANALLKQAQANLDAATLTAPFAGVVAATGAKPGEQLRTSAEGAVITLVDTRQVRMDDAVFLPDAVRIAQVTGELGGSAQPGARVLYATSNTPEVQLNLEPSQQGEVKEGDRVQVTLPDRQVVTGKVARIGRVAQVPAAQQNNGKAGAPTVPAYVSLDEPEKARGLDKAPVQVGITARAVQNVLSVPVTALVGKSGGGFAVEVVRAGGARELVTVKLGLFDTTGGWVQVEGDLHEGDQVVVPSQ